MSVEMLLELAAPEAQERGPEGKEGRSDERPSDPAKPAVSRKGGEDGVSVQPS
jgi:hypothetical protein